ncbi:hypothetical protein V491_05948, partial [Pseudogymnoascus sp. VKM F-3775]
MTLIGVSLLIATFTFFLFKVPPSTWLASWFPRKADSGGDVSRDDLNQTGAGQVEDGSETKGEKGNKEDKEDTAPPDAGVKEAKAELDRKAMPPPPTFLVKAPNGPSSEAPPARAAPLQPSPRGQGLSAPALPSFPALNSA